jgi:hypothetical protein
MYKVVIDISFYSFDEVHILNKVTSNSIILISNLNNILNLNEIKNQKQQKIGLFFKNN